MAKQGNSSVKRHIHIHKHIYKYNTNKLSGKRYYSTNNKNNINPKENNKKPISQEINWTSIKKGFIKGFNMPLLPDSISKIYNLPLIRILRVIGGISAVLVLSKNYIYLPDILHWPVLILGLLQLIQMTVISMIKIVYAIRKLIKNPEEFEVRNSPLNKYATQLANLIYCWKVGCTVVGGGVGVIGGGVVIDQVLEAGGQSKVFLPFMGRGIKFILGNGTNQDVTTVYENIKRNLQELESAEERKEYITKYIDKISSEDLSKYNISEADAKDIKNVLKEIYEFNNKDLSKFKSKILLEVEKLKDNVDK